MYILTSSYPVSSFHLAKLSADLIPVEEFRHTPIIPISEKELFKHKQKIEEKNRKGYYVEIRKDTIYFYTISLLTLVSPSIPFSWSMRSKCVSKRTLLAPRRFEQSQMLASWEVPLWKNGMSIVFKAARMPDELMFANCYTC